MEGFDVGALYSVGFGCYLVFFFWADKTQASRGIVSGLGGLALVALAAAWMASQGLLTLVGTRLNGAPSSDTPALHRQRLIGILPLNGTCLSWSQ